MICTVTAVDVREGDRVLCPTGDTYTVRRREIVELCGERALILVVHAPTEDRLVAVSQHVRTRIPTYDPLDEVQVIHE